MQGLPSGWGLGRQHPLWVCNTRPAMEEAWLPGLHVSFLTLGGVHLCLASQETQACVLAMPFHPATEADGALGLAQGTPRCLPFRAQP